MSSINCDPTCLAFAPVFTALGCDPKASVRTGFIKSLVFWRCDIVPILDITDEVEIAGYVAAQTAVSLPPLTATLPAPDLSDEVTENCNAPIALKRTWNLEATSIRTDPAGNTDFVEYNQLDQSLATWFMTWVDCENNIFVPQTFATGGEPGFQANGQITPIWDNTSSMKWQFNLSFVYDEIPKGIKLTDAVADALGL